MSLRSVLDGYNTATIFPKFFQLLHDPSYGLRQIVER